MTINGERILYERIVMLEDEYNKERDRADDAEGLTMALLDALAGMVAQHCYTTVEGEYTHNCTQAEEDAFDILEKVERIERIPGRKERWRFKGGRP